MDQPEKNKKRSDNRDNSFQSKMQRFLIAALLADGIVGIAINIFFQNKYNSGTLNPGDNFLSPSLIWGHSIWWNLLHFLILFFIAGLFGYIFGYFSRKVSTDDKVLFGSFYVFLHFFLLGLILVIADIFYEGYWTDLDGMVNLVILEVNSSSLVILFLILDCLGMIFSSIYFMNKGSKAARNSNYPKEKNKRGIFLGIKLYHYLWLCVPIIFYSQVILNFMYQFLNGVVAFVMTKSISWGNLFWLAVISGISIFLMAYLQKILSGKIKKELSIRILIAIGIGLIIPMLILLLTPFAG